jgi:hypothetical protein
MNSVSEKASDFIQDLGDAVRKDPLSAALIGMGALWLFRGGRPLDRASDLVRNTDIDRIPDAAGNAFDAARSSLRSGAGAVGDRGASAKDGAAQAFASATRHWPDYADSASEYVTALPGTGAEMLDNLRSNLADVFRAQPLALAAIGIAIGAGIAAALPRTEIEADYLGETSEAMKATATEFAAEQADRVTEVAGNVVDAVADEARKQGLTLEGARSAASAISAKVGRVVDAAGKGISERATFSQQ